MIYQKYTIYDKNHQKTIKNDDLTLFVQRVREYKQKDLILYRTGGKGGNTCQKYTFKDIWRPYLTHVTTWSPSGYRMPKLTLLGLRKLQNRPPGQDGGNGPRKSSKKGRKLKSP